VSGQLAFDSLANARRRVQAGLNEGIVCPCCDQRVRRYRRSINSVMAAGLLVLLRLTDGDTGIWVNVRRINKDLSHLKTSNPTSDFSKLSWWDFIAAKPNEDHKKRSSGEWRITRRGVLFASETARRHAIVYDGIVEGWGDESTDIFECLGDRFDYRELMRPVQQ